MVSSSSEDQKAEAKLPRHVSIIMDGNGRWAKKRFLPRIEGHRAGAKSVRMVVEESRRLGIRYLTLYTFSTENWNRPGKEVAALMKMLESYLKSELELMLKNDVRLRAIGDLERLPEGVRNTLWAIMEQTSDLQGLDLILALSYGGREEIVQACRKIAGMVKNDEVSSEQIDEQLVRSSLYLADVPDPEVVIRTSNEVRLSNFLLWQAAYSELIISPVFWPDFSKEEYHRCLEEYSQRKRRFGLTAEQLQ